MNAGIADCNDGDGDVKKKCFASTLETLSLPPRAWGTCRMNVDIGKYTEEATPDLDIHIEKMLCSVKGDVWG